MDEANVQELRDELARLMREHIDSMARQTFLGITPEQLRQETERMQRIRQVSAELLEALKRIPP
jgi:hypothetical protein